MGSLGFKEILLVVLVIVLLFGARRIPELMRSMGQGIREFKGGLKESRDDEKPKSPPGDDGKH